MSLGDVLGRLAAPATAAPFEAQRLAMVDRLLVASANGTPAHALWQTSFEQAIDEVAGRITTDAERDLRAAAVRSRMPARVLASRLPDAGYLETLRNRLLAAGMLLERLEGTPADEATQRRRGVALEGAWDDAMRRAGEERDRWRGTALAVREWRRPTRSLWAATGVVLVLTIVAAEWLGGWWPAPGWFAPVSQAFWSVPW